MFETLTNTLQSISQRIFKKTKITTYDVETMLSSMREALLAADVPQSVVENLLKTLKTRVIGQKLVDTSTKAAEQISHALIEEVKALLGPDEKFPTLTFPATLMFVGLQGSGKTTSLAKLTHHLHQQHPQARILVASLDFYRPAAREQLQQLAQRIKIDYYATVKNDPLGAAHELMQHTRAHPYDMVLVDTAGRLHTDVHLLKEIEDIAALVRPQCTLLALDAMTGQASLQVAQEFQKTIPLTGGILTKTDSGARAGVALAFREITQKPIFFMGTGEGINDFEPFVPQRIVQRLFGEGDLLSLAEKVESRISAASLEKTNNAFMSGTMNLEDFAHCLTSFSSLGSLTALSQYLPAGLGFKISPEQAREKEREIARFKAIISSMTPKERLAPKILSTPRKRRIARGSGLAAAQVDKLLIAFEEMQGYAKLVKRFEKSSLHMPNTKRK